VRYPSLEALLASPTAPANWEAVLRGFTAVIARLRALEARAVAVDPDIAGAEVFRDPERVPDAERLVERLAAVASPPPGPADAFRREAFVVDAANELAVKAADEVAAAPGQRYNPLYLHGPRGAGKTHLAHALAHEIRARHGESVRVAVVRGQEFADELIAALQEGTVSRWRARYRVVDALIVDDVHAVNGTERTQEELFHVFNALASEGRQLVFVADRPPRALAALEERLRSRFEGGLVAEMGPRRAAPPPRPEAAPRLSMPMPARAQDSFFLDDEKVLWTWPDLASRVIEEVR